MFYNSHSLINFMKHVNIIFLLLEFILEFIKLITKFINLHQLLLIKS